MSKNEYTITWRSDGERPEDQMDTNRRDKAVMQMIEQTGVDMDSVTYCEPKRQLSGGSVPVFEVCSFVVDNFEALVILYQYLRERSDSYPHTEAEIEEMIDERIDERLEEIDD